MSNAVFPSLPGLQWDVKMRPRFETMVQTAKSGKEIRAAFMQYPIWEFDVSFSLLRSGAAFLELQTLAGFFNSRQGKFDTWLYDNPLDDAVTAQQFGVGNGSVLAYQLTRSFGGFTEPVQNVNGTPQIFVNDWQGNQLQYATPRIQSCLQSEDFSTTWSPASLTVSTNVSVAPDGTNTVDRLLEVAASAEHFIEQGALPYPNATNVILSVYASPQNGRNFLRLSVVQRDAATVLGAGFNVATGAIVGTSGGVTAFTPQLMSNGQYRCSILVSVGSGGSASRIRVQASTDGNTLVYLGDVTKGLNVWGANALDATAIAVPSSYIKAVAAAVTVTDYVLSTLGIVTFAVAPLLSALLTWTGSYYYRCRFMDDISEFNNFMNQLWENKKLSFLSVKL